jgi:hypothetical protein
MSEEENQQQEDELWVELPEPEEITEEEANELPIDVYAEEEGEPDEQPAGVMELGRQPKRRPDRFIELRGGPFGHKFFRDANLRVPVFFEQNHIATIGLSKAVRGPAGFRCFVMINSQRMRELRATQRGMQLLLNHEAQGHCRGYGHGEANPQVNPAFNPGVNVRAR